MRNALAESNGIYSDINWFLVTPTSISRKSEGSVKLTHVTLNLIFRLIQGSI